jgi:hypothetical protein
LNLMTAVSRILGKIDEGIPQAAAQLLPVVYDELRRLAARKLAADKAGPTPQAAATRRILIEWTRRRRRKIHGGEPAPRRTKLLRRVDRRRDGCDPRSFVQNRRP